MRVSGFILLVFILSYPLTSSATHLRAADILAEQECGTLRYKITVRVFLNTLSGTPFGGYNASDGHIDFGDGSPIEVIMPSNIEGPVSRPDLGPEISVASYTTYHRFAVPGMYKVTYFERDRSEGILNITNSLDVAYATFVEINAQWDQCNKLPVLQVAPVDRACKGVVFFHNPGATDSDGDSISYELSIPSENATSFVSGYRPPDHASFYSDFDHGNEAGTGPPSLQVNSETGLITWDAPGVQGEYNIAFKIIEWRFDPGTAEYFIISTSVRDMQIIVEDCLNKRPSITGPADVCIMAGETLSGIFKGADPENHPVKIELFSSIFEGGPETFPATFSPATVEFRPSNPPAEVEVEWKTNCIHVRDQVYQVVIKITDRPPAGPSLVTFRTWNIKVIAPPPVWTTLQPDLVNRTALLEWNDYSCQNADKIQLWRKVGSFPFAPGQCVAGLSVHRGYSLIAELDPSVTSYTDTNNGKKLAVGAQYCYRLVAVFSLPAGGKSYVSQEACVGPILADAPVITNVTVHKTAQKNGEIEIRWTKPFDISPEQYPEPYEYEVYRSGGFFQEQSPVNISGRVRDVTSYVDLNANTEDSVYNYQVVLYSRTINNAALNAIDTSAIASSVRLDTESGEGMITLKWRAEVPWSNVIEDHSYHRIYRGIHGQDLESFDLIDSVEVSEFGFEYSDTGKFRDEPIQPDVYYCYYVQTLGSYGNPKIGLLRNLSQTACAYPINNLPLCTPVLSVKKTDCENFLTTNSCDAASFANELTWSFDGQTGCRKDAVQFNLYYSDLLEGEYTLLSSFHASQHAFNDPVTMLSRCYKISAVNADGTESELSVPVCNENCPYFELPNVFTPNGDGCNDLFRTYHPSEENGNCVLGDATKCPRFVKSVSFKVLNRWGRIIYEYQSDDQHPIYIDWNGRDSNGTPLDAGVYFYTANVEFFATNPADGKQELRGWINLVR